jgi:dual specificity protein phosphatase-like protein
VVGGAEEKGRERTLRLLTRYWPLRAWWVYWLGLSNEAPSRLPTEVEDGVWVGGIPLPGRWRALQAAGVTRVVTLLGEASPAPWLRSAESLLWLPVRDNHPPTMDQLRRGCAFLDSGRSDGPATLISCGAGIGRASTLYLAWRMATTGEPLREALDALRRRRPVVAPTARQLESLGQWEEELRG